MNKMPFGKYRPFAPIVLPDRQWPNRVITRAPAWCSVDLRDGNQALIEPMSPSAKQRMFDLLLEMGFKEIEVGFPAASQTDFDFLRQLIDDHLIPDDVTIQVLTQAREPLIRRTFEAIRGARRSVVHLYNSTSELQRRVVFNADRDAVIDIAVAGTKLVRDIASQEADGEIVFQYSPESFTGTELDFAREITEAVMEVWQPTPDKKMIINLPATVEMSTPNIYADQIEWFCRNVAGRDCLSVSLHPHNDRGTGVAAAEFGLMAGADRVEGTLFGNGERTGNVDIITLAMNMVTQGVDPGLMISDINHIIEVSAECTQLDIHPRHPYAGALVFTAFSGSHQDAIKKGLAALQKSGANHWEVPYLPIDPADLGRNYEAVIRINSQSGKGGVAYLLERDFGLLLPRPMQIEFSKVVQKIADASGKELTPALIKQAFDAEYLTDQVPYGLTSHQFDHINGIGRTQASLRIDGCDRLIEGQGNGPIDAFINGLQSAGITVQLLDFHEHAIGRGAGAKAVAYVQIKGHGNNGASDLCGAGIDEDIVTASLRAVLSALNRKSKMLS
jgi:2-isopropylmalate synthase